MTHSPTLERQEIVQKAVFLIFIFVVGIIYFTESGIASVTQERAKNGGVVFFSGLLAFVIFGGCYALIYLFIIWMSRK
jgi:amino acid transporter